MFAFMISLNQNHAKKLSMNVTNMSFVQEYLLDHWHAYFV